MKICLHTKNIYYTAGCKNINSYEDVLAYERHLIHRCKNINSYEDSFVYEKTFNTLL